VELLKTMKKLQSHAILPQTERKLPVVKTEENSQALYSVNRVQEDEKEMWFTYSPSPNLSLLNSYNRIRTQLDEDKHWDELHEETPDPLYSN